MVAIWPEAVVLQTRTAFHNLNVKVDEQILSLQARFSYSNVLWSTEKTYNEDTGKDLNQTVILDKKYIYCKM